MTTRNPLPPGVVRSRANTELEFKLKALRGTVGTDATPFTHIRSGSKYVGEFGTLVNEQSLVAIAKPDELKAMGLTLPAVMPSSGQPSSAQEMATAILGTGIPIHERQAIADGLRAKAFSPDNPGFVHVRLDEGSGGAVVFDTNVSPQVAVEIAALLDPPAPRPDFKGSTAQAPGHVSAGDVKAGNAPAAQVMIEGIPASNGLTHEETLGVVDKVLAERRAREAGERVNNPFGGAAFVGPRAAPAAIYGPTPSRVFGGANFADPKAIVHQKMSSLPSPEQALVKRFSEWVTKPFVLQRPGHSVSHKLMQHVPLTRWVFSRSENRMIAGTDLDTALSVIMVEHDWARLLGDAHRSGVGVGEWHPPYDIQAFEFQITGAAVVATVAAAGGSDDDPLRVTMSLACRPPGGSDWVSDRCTVEVLTDGWAPLVGKELVAAGEAALNAQFARLYDYLFAQIKACSIMLDAEVAVVETTRAPYKTNQPAKEAKPLPKLSHHVVRLNRKPRYAPEPGGAGVERNRPRLHLRRGHFRHYPLYKKWIRWMIVGNADLGWVDKEYRQ